ncbi:LacI family DNA-binding transcriptional regulator [Winslowiella iniecta]|uniref:LacI family transcriptional regulator n=1 Tax=Winslowiella iniecta TaxID=1560201 RepID=A0A0L7T1D1_9GAMM|nr:LacI family DNA-binding transcriptional regulator [Winslowiella iniecta]KOC89100.1 LacI family transcriptional regulator [Winslowiella iniecta]KOC91031.1 LacI family transcriptional regulator [Winslowiella iniecta]
MRNITIKDIAQQAGVGVATVDRVLNRRAPVRQETEAKVIAAATGLGYRFPQGQPPASQPVRAGQTVKMGFILLPKDYSFYQQFCQQLMQQAAPWHHDDSPPEFYFHAINAIEATAARIRELATRVDVIGLVALDNALIRHAVEEVTRQGVKVFALLSDLSPCGHAGYIGLDNRKAGRTAAWAVERLQRKSGKIGIIIGDNQFLCQETCEISFRSYLRERLVGHQILEPVKSYENIAGGYLATTQLLQQHQDLSVIYAPCGGVEGVINAIEEHGRREAITLISHGPFDNSDLALINGTVELIVAHRLTELSAAVIAAFRQSVLEKNSGFINHTCPFELLTAENC